MAWGKRTDMIVHELDPYNAEPSAAALLGQELTATDTFYSRNHGPVPEVDPAGWRLEVTGLVQQPLQLSLSDLQERFSEHTLPATLQCAGNRRAGLLQVREIPGEDPWRGGATSTATWTGVRLGEVLQAAGLAAEVDQTTAHVCFEAPDVSQLAAPPQSYGASIPLEKALSSEVLLAWAMNAEPLSAIHGAPLRIVVPGWIGARSVKWVTRITISPTPSRNYFQATAYRLLPPEADPTTAGEDDGLSLGPVALNCEILTPADGERVPASRFTVAGYAYAGEQRRVSRVDVSVDGGTSWQQAHLEAPAGKWTWQHWRCQVDAGSMTGTCRVLARAWDDTGALQPREAADVWNPKGYVNNSWPHLSIHLAPEDT